MLQIINKIEFNNNLWLGLVDSSHFNSSETEKIKAVTDMAAITKGKLGQNYKEEEFTDIICKRRENLYNRLLTESAGKPSVPFEFIPVIEKVNKSNHYDYSDLEYLTNNYYKLDDKGNFYFQLSNLRQEINSWIYNIPEEVENFKIIIGRIPKFVFDHIIRHRAFSFLCESSRNKRYLNEVEFWYPENWSNLVQNNTRIVDRSLVQRLKLDIEAKSYTPEEATKELSSRRLITFGMCAWKQDKNAWDNLFAVRGEGTGTQKITQEIINNIKNLINK